MMDAALAFAVLAILSSTPLLLAVCGELVLEKSGMINISLEGMMLTAAATAVAGAKLSGSAPVGFAAGIAGAALIGLLFGILTISTPNDQIVAGTGLNLLALGLTGVFYQRFSTFFVEGIPQVPAWSFGSSRLDAVVLLSWIVFPPLLTFGLWRTRAGLRLRGCGENPATVTAAGGSVGAYRWAALAVEALLAGIGGAYLSLALSSGFAENMVSGRGFIALAIVIFGRWRLKGAIAGALLFGAAGALQYWIQARSGGVQFHLLLAIPYVLTLAVLLVARGRVQAPEALARIEPEI